MTDKERDDALIAEAERLAYFLECKEGTLEAEAMFRRAVAILRGDERPKPDRAEKITRATIGNYLAFDQPEGMREAIRFMKDALAELRAEWEAERPAVVVPEDDWSKGKEDCDGNELVTFRKDDLVKQMVTRFLGWKLPEDFRPDDGISFEPFFNVEWNAKQGKPPQRRTPTGTNLLNATQAEAMVRYMLGDDT